MEQSSTILTKFSEKLHGFSDIYQHMGVLAALAGQCIHVTEAGVRCAVSSYAFAMGLLGKPGAKLVQIDLIDSVHAQQFRVEAAFEGLNVVFYEQSDLDCPQEATDLLFIDTWHVYGHLKRELARWCNYANKYIVLHDTTVDEVFGETLRERLDGPAQSAATGIPLDEIHRGIWPAVTEFLDEHSEWVLYKRFVHNNGLTILKRRPCAVCGAAKTPVIG